MSATKTGSRPAALMQVDLEQMVGQMIMVGFKGTGEPGMHGNIDALQRSIRVGRVGGIILFEPDYLTKGVRNITSKVQAQHLIKKLQRQAKIMLFVGVDQEGGRVQRFKEQHDVQDVPSAQALGEEDPAQTRRIAGSQGRQLKEIGINLNFAPVLDVNIHPENPAIGKLGRAFSGDPKKVIAHAQAFAQGLHDENILFCYKHFPGQGSAVRDTHLGLTDVSDTWSQAELLPFQALIKNNMPGMVMVGHVYNKYWDETYSASLSKKVIEGMLRRQLGWSGVVISDDLQMQALSTQYTLEETIARAVTAGVDILLFGNNLDFHEELAENVFATVMRLVAQGCISQERIAASYNRIMQLKQAVR